MLFKSKTKTKKNINLTFSPTYELIKSLLIFFSFITTLSDKIKLEY